MEVGGFLFVLLAWVIPVLFGITIHEWAHGRMAYHLGDSTAKFMGRLSLNPIPHIDLVGTILVPILFYSIGGVVFGWAKPVPINYNALKGGEIGVIKVAMAGPISNLFMMVGFMMIYVTLINVWGSSEVNFFNGFVFEFLKAGMLINIVLFAFNMLPIPPLDGSSILRYFMSPDLRMAFDRFSSSYYSMGVIILLAVSGVLGWYLSLVMSGMFLPLVGLFLG